MGIWADDMRLRHQGFCHRMFDARQGDGERDIETKTRAVVARADTDGRRHGAVVQDFDLRLRRDELDGAQETGSVTGREQLLGIGGVPAGAAEFLGGRELYRELAVIGGGATVAAARGDGFGGIEDAHAQAPMDGDTVRYP